MWHVGVDLHRKTVVIAAVHDTGEVRPPVRFACSQTAEIESHFRQLGEFRAVVEASGTYRWFHRLVSPLGTVVLAHPFLLRAIVQRRSKTDRLDAQLLANLLRINQIPLSYIPSDEYQLLRDLTRYRARLGRGLASVKTSLRALLARHNREAFYKYPFGPRGLYWFSKQTFGPADDMVRDELLARFLHYSREIAAAERRLEELRPNYPQVEALTELYGIGLYSAMFLVGELGDVTRFRRAKQVAAYAGLTARVHQSGEHCYRGHVSKQGSPWLRWILVEAAMKLVRRDVALANFYNRIRRRAGTKIARVAASRKLAEICWKRLMRWHAEHAPATPAAA
jgi:transposase